LGEGPAATKKPDSERGERMSAPAVSAPPLPSILLASAGEPLDPKVVDHAITVARSTTSFVHVLSIARIWGTALGIQHPGLFPTKREWQAQLEIVGDAVRTLRRAGLEAKGGVIASRNPSKVITRQAGRFGCSAIVVGSRPLSWWMSYLLQDEVWWIVRRSSIPVIPVEYTPGSVPPRGRRSQ
jgi:nucleotide-binding universal stress UspA family protein